MSYLLRTGVSRLLRTPNLHLLAGVAAQHLLNGDDIVVTDLADPDAAFVMCVDPDGDRLSKGGLMIAIDWTPPTRRPEWSYDVERLILDLT